MPILLLMTDGEAPTDVACDIIREIDDEYSSDSLQVHFIAFGAGASIDSLERMKEQTTDGYIHRSQMGELATTFKSIESSLMVAEYT